MLYKLVKSEVDKIAKAKKIPKSYLMDIFETPFELAAQIIKQGPDEKGKFKNIRIPGFCLFYVSKRKQESYLRRLEEKLQYESNKKL